MNPKTDLKADAGASPCGGVAFGMKRFIFPVWVVFAAPLLSVIVNPLSIQELTAKAQLIVHGTVLTKSCQRDPEGRIYTKVQLQVKDAWKGTPSSHPLTIVHGGGTLGEERVEVSGQVEYSVGEDVVAFLVLNQRNEAVTVGLAQGKFHVWKDEATGQLLVRNPFHGAEVDAPGPNLSHTVTPPARLTLSTLIARVKGEEK